MRVVRGATQSEQQLPHIKKEWNGITKSLNSQAQRYWDALIKKSHKLKNPRSTGVWTTPKLGWIMLKFDALFVGKEAHTLLVRRPMLPMSLEIMRVILCKSRLVILWLNLLLNPKLKHCANIEISSGTENNQAGN